MIIGLIATALGVYAIFSKKLSAQAMCVKSVSQLQTDLGRDLTALIKLNPEAKRLRSRRAKADATLAKALASGNPPAIAAARALQSAVILQQKALRTRQEAILQSAKLQRGKAARSLSMKVRPLGVTSIQGKFSSQRALAVEASPATSISPDYLPVQDFARQQEQEFTFDLNLAPDFIQLDLRQKTLCSATLKNEEGKWREKITAASLWSKQP